MDRGGTMSEAPSQQQRVVIAGASGFIGRALTKRLANRFEVIALSRAKPSEAATPGGVRWHSCDLFSLRETSLALAGADYAIYLVHSMMPSARLTQASFADLDLVLADNFARAAQQAGVKQIVYLGGLMPPGESLSPHLASRLEVERILGSRGVPVTAVRAGLVVGAGGSSLQILVRLVRRLPVMLCPTWTKTLAQPIDQGDVVEVVAGVVGAPDMIGAVLHVGGPDVLSYRELMLRTAAVLGKRTRAFSVPFFSPGLSRLWVTLVTKTPRALVAPLIQSLRHPMVAAGNDLALRLGRPGLGFEASLRRALADEAASAEVKQETHQATLAADRQRLRKARTVRSIQRLPLPPGCDAEWVAREYAAWLPRKLWPLIDVDVAPDGNCSFRLRPLGLTLLRLRLDTDVSTSDRQLFRIEGGALVRRRDGVEPGKLEFRVVMDNRFVLAAIHDFEPALPWPVYASTQALIHLWVMRRFGRYLTNGRICEKPPSTAMT